MDRESKRRLSVAIIAVVTAMFLFMPQRADAVGGRQKGKVVAKRDLARHSRLAVRDPVRRQPAPGPEMAERAPIRIPVVYHPEGQLAGYPPMEGPVCWIEGRREQQLLPPFEHIWPEQPGFEPIKPIEMPWAWPPMPPAEPLEDPGQWQTPREPAIQPAPVDPFTPHRMPVVQPGEPVEFPWEGPATWQLLPVEPVPVEVERLRPRVPGEIESPPELPWQASPFLEAIIAQEETHRRVEDEERVLEEEPEMPVEAQHAPNEDIRTYIQEEARTQEQVRQINLLLGLYRWYVDRVREEYVHRVEIGLRNLYEFERALSSKDVPAELLGEDGMVGKTFATARSCLARARFGAVERAEHVLKWLEGYGAELEERPLRPPHTVLVTPEARIDVQDNPEATLQALGIVEGEVSTLTSELSRGNEPSECYTRAMRVVGPGLRGEGYEAALNYAKGRMQPIPRESLAARWFHQDLPDQAEQESARLQELWHQLHGALGQLRVQRQRERSPAPSPGKKSWSAFAT